ncbi:hypothetical protein ACJRO7_012677, partial [Eucalyptus globulus]
MLVECYCGLHMFQRAIGSLGIGNGCGASCCCSEVGAVVALMVAVLAVRWRRSR